MTGDYEYKFSLSAWLRVWVRAENADDAEARLQAMLKKIERDHDCKIEVEAALPTLVSS
jgi:hypothetical protein